jgi:hypothetical protein
VRGSLSRTDIGGNLRVSVCVAWHGATCSAENKLSRHLSMWNAPRQATVDQSAWWISCAVFVRRSTVPSGATARITVCASGHLPAEWTRSVRLIGVALAGVLQVLRGAKCTTAGNVTPCIPLWHANLRRGQLQVASDSESDDPDRDRFD